VTDVTNLGNRDAELARILAAAVRTMTSDFEYLDLANQLAVSTTHLLGAEAAGVMLEDGFGALQALSASDEDTRLLEVFELQQQEGPCYECWRTGLVVSAPDISGVARWPAFAEEVRGLGFVSAIAVPLRLRTHVVGALNVFWTTRRVATPADLDAAQTLADLAAVGLVQQRLARETTVLAEQLEWALHSRVTIEQAKGIISAKARVSISEASIILVEAAREGNRSIVSVATDVVDRTLVWEASNRRLFAP
jgi:GAF domain-containing protein